MVGQNKRFLQGKKNTFVTKIKTTTTTKNDMFLESHRPLSEFKKKIAASLSLNYLHNFIQYSIILRIASLSRTESSSNRVFILVFIRIALPHQSQTTNVIHLAHGRLIYFSEFLLSRSNYTVKVENGTENTFKRVDYVDIL